MDIINRQLLGEEQEENNMCNSPNTANEENQEEQGGQIIAFESKVLDYINKQHYHGLV